MKLLAILVIWISGFCFGGLYQTIKTPKCPTIEHHGGRAQQPAPPQPRNWDQDA